MSKYTNFVINIFYILLVLFGFWVIEYNKHYYVPSYDTKFLHYQGDKVQLCIWIDDETHTSMRSYSRDQLDNAVNLAEKELDRLTTSSKVRNEPLTDEEFNKQIELIELGVVPPSKVVNKDDEPKLYCYKLRSINETFVPK